jgi:4-amino-4-deoxy-L-arabinose transferase-like glycosyltransferase
MIPQFFLTFSDGAKYANIARNLVNGLGYGDSFNFWDNTIFSLLKQKTFPALWTPPVMPFSVATFFKMFGINDFAVIATSIFYFTITLVFIYLLASNVFKNKLVGVLSTLAIGFNYDLLNYATSGASEAPFIFEIVAGAYFISLKKKWGTAITIIFLILLYFTRTQAFIYIAGLVFFYLLQKFSLKKAMMYFVLISISAFFVDKLFLVHLNGKYFFYSLFYRSLSQINQVSSGVSIPTSNSLRGEVFVVQDVRQNLYTSLFKNIFYNFYNFYKLLPQIMSSFMFVPFLIGLFRWKKDKTENSFKIATVLMVAATFLATAASIPFFRYLHPVVPLIYIMSVGTLVWIVGKIFNENKFIIGVSTFLVLFFCVGQTLGVVFLDSRFVKNTHNTTKPPTYVQLSNILRNNTKNNQVILTNLDTWGSWYGERKTVWFPLLPKQIIDSATGQIPFDAIYLTSYLIDDENYYMGAEWRTIFNNPDNPKLWTCDGCDEIAKEFELKAVYKILSTETYERQDASAVLLVKK